ncbi:Ankyrin repeat domain-containing protein 50 [Symbiodinium microadriaticum]|uniref:Ankyrin repeat domain-containing protein 50 n=1 Tax=Symbiodinium microadriaticum TaxID=2951 RepID=A0A1Q9DNH1_SYMMI|nr:Ankyrin repeat domain-containing protein 50 [Symbiodinium microadriaticum]
MPKHHLREMRNSNRQSPGSSIYPESIQEIRRSLYWILEEHGVACLNVLLFLDGSSCQGFLVLSHLKGMARFPSPEVTVSSRTLGGREVCFQIGAWEPVLSVKRRVASELRVPDFTIQLVQQGVTLKSETMLKELLRDDVTDPSLDLVIVRIPGQLLDYRQLLHKLVHAANHSRFEEVRQLLDEGAGFDAEGNLLLDFGSNVLHVAVRGRLNDLALHLISQGVDLESCNEMGRTPLVQACIKNTPEVITALLAARADVNIKDSSGRSAVYYAAMKENAAAVQQLIEAGADSEELESVVDLESCNEMGRTPLVQACIKNAPEVITALLAARADVNIKDSSGRSAVYYAAMKENAAAVQQLIEAGADSEELESVVDLESCNEMGRTPLVQACIKNAPEVITALLAARADVNIKDSSGRSAVYYAAMKENAAAVQQLIEAGADSEELESVVDLESCNEMGRTPLVQACIKNAPEVITALLAARADVNIKDSSGRSAVYYAAMKENAAAVQQLIEAGADSEELESVVDLESCNEMGRTPLVQACIKNAPEVITALLAARADVNIKDSSGRSAVYYAAMKENAAVVQQLIEAGADPEELEMLGCSGLRPLQTPKNWRSYLTCWAPWKM